MQAKEDRRGTILIGIARREISSKLGQMSEVDEPNASDEPWLLEPGAVFVTLEHHGVLRGCVGSLSAVQPLIEDVRENAVGAASRDTRFSPVEAHELAGLEIGITELSKPEPMCFSSEADALAQLRPGEDGVVLSWGGRRATFLPQVWDSLPESKIFLTQLKRKAGLADDFWDDAVKLERYVGRKWSES